MVYNKKEYDSKYKKNNYDHIGIYTPKGTNDFLNDYAKNNGITKTQLIKNAIEAYCHVDLNNGFKLKD